MNKSRIQLEKGEIMAKRTVFECDICGKDISNEQFYIFRDYHYRIGFFRKYHMCISCMKRIREELRKEKDK